ncbi:MAG: helix-turn-helix transcriptional regulator [Pseudomonadales bacterium]|jgi:transcriptional regulator with XRE-family HTH domain|nr:helix-turn-helix transcriptional regulator [Pseudomonadales bacterium]
MSIKTVASEVVGVEPVSAANRLKAIRELAGLTQREVEERTGVKQGDISAMERGKKAMGLRVARRLSSGLGIPVTRLIAEEEDARLAKFQMLYSKIESEVKKEGLLEFMEKMVNSAKRKPVIVKKGNAVFSYKVTGRVTARATAKKKGVVMKRLSGKKSAPAKLKSA